MEYTAFWVLLLDCIIIKSLDGLSLEYFSSWVTVTLSNTPLVLILGDFSILVEDPSHILHFLVRFLDFLISLISSHWRAQNILLWTFSLFYLYTYCRPETNRLTYFSSKDGLIWDQQRIEIRGLQPWWATCKSLQRKGRTLL